MNLQQTKHNKTAGWVILWYNVVLGPLETRALFQYKDRLSEVGDSHVKDKTVGETVLSLTWESLYW